MKTARKRRPVEPERVTPREFIEAWQGSSSVAEVAKKIGSLKKAVRVRAYRYRKLGIRLKQFEPVELPDWDELAEYAESLAPFPLPRHPTILPDPGCHSPQTDPEAPAVHEDVQVDEARSNQVSLDPSDGASSEKTASQEAE